MDAVLAAALALIAAAKPDRADHGRTVLLPREVVEALRAAVEAAKRDAGK